MFQNLSPVHNSATITPKQIRFIFHFSHPFLVYQTQKQLKGGTSETRPGDPDETVAVKMEEEVKRAAQGCHRT